MRIITQSTLKYPWTTESSVLCINFSILHQFVQLAAKLLVYIAFGARTSSIFNYYNKQRNVTKYRQVTFQTRARWLFTWLTLHADARDSCVCVCWWALRHRTWNLDLLLTTNPGIRRVIRLLLPDSKIGPQYRVKKRLRCNFDPCHACPRVCLQPICITLINGVMEHAGIDEERWKLDCARSTLSNMRIW